MSATVQSKPISALLPRMSAAVIDAILVAVLDCLLMYIFWIIGMVTGILDASPDHWVQMIYTSPLFLLDGFTVLAAPAAWIYLNNAQAFPVETQTLANFFFLALICTNWLYHAGFESSAVRGTPGKVFVDIAIVGSNGRPISFAHASLRHFAKALGVFTFFLPIFGNARKSCLHDLLSRSSVVSEV